MLFGKLKSTTLLERAANADFAAQAALATAQRLKAKATAKRALAARVEAEEKAERLEKDVITAELLVAQIESESSAIIIQQDNAKAALAAVNDAAVRAIQRLADERKCLDALRSLATKARAAVTSVETKVVSGHLKKA
jgi:hypothetical protein